MEKFIKISHIKEFVKKYERHIGPVAIIAGFIWDILILGRPDQLFGNITVITYLVISALGIILINIYEKKKGFIPIILLALVQFTFGNLAGSIVVFYGKSGTFEGSYLFFLILGAFIIGNEFLRGHYAKMNFNISAWYLLSLAYFVLIVPVLLGKIGTTVFILSGILSLLVIYVFVYLIYKISATMGPSSLRKTTGSILGIFIIFNALYFYNILPPVPLSLTHIGIYHSISRQSNGNYEVTYEKSPWYEFWDKTSGNFTQGKGENVYCFTSVFAPVRLATPISHKWEYYNEIKSEWETASTLKFPIVGGRESGYRAYSREGELSEGKWRCSAETERGALIGRKTFNIIKGTTTPGVYSAEL